MLPQIGDGHSLSLVNLEYFQKEVIEGCFLLFVLEEVLSLDVVDQFKPTLALGVDIIEHVDTLEGKFAKQQVEEQHSQ